MISTRSFGLWFWVALVFGEISDRKTFHAESRAHIFIFTSICYIYLLEFDIFTFAIQIFTYTMVPSMAMKSRMNNP